jgi:hypothetical protein
MNLGHPGSATLFPDLSREIDLVMRRPNTRAELDYQILGLGSEPATHQLNRLHCYP